MLKSICGYKRLRLTEGKRSCRELFDFYSSCSHSGWRYALPLEDLVNEARRRFPNKGFGDVNLVISHKRRVAINMRVQANRLRKERPTDTLHLGTWKQALANTSQPMILWPGVPLTAALDGLSRCGIYNSQLLTVQGWDQKNVELKCAEGGAIYNITHEFCRKNLRLAYAMTYASIQARTCHGTVALWDTKHPRFSRRHLIVGMSRCTRASHVWLAD